MCFVTLVLVLGLAGSGSVGILNISEGDVLAKEALIIANIVDSEGPISI